MTAVTKEDIRLILSDSRIFSTSIEEFGNDAELGLDSLSLVWLVHRLEEEHGVSLDPDALFAAGVTSVDSIHTLLTGAP
ncbi:acyl carrier protein [Streptomyces gamaensis]|uniref:Acyl carrier protein n=1 Tax=Streptomyces gamaensis TaxID=1763542 RepID=A0ABW0YRZ9_9ACTN